MSWHVYDSLMSPLGWHRQKLLPSSALPSQQTAWEGSCPISMPPATGQQKLATVLCLAAQHVIVYCPQPPHVLLSVNHLGSKLLNFHSQRLNEEDKPCTKCQMQIS